MNNSCIHSLKPNFQIPTSHFYPLLQNAHASANFNLQTTPYNFCVPFPTPHNTNPATITTSLKLNTGNHGPTLT